MPVNEGLLKQVCKKFMAAIKVLVRFSLGSNSGFIHGEDRRVCLWIISFDCDKEKVECSVEKFFLQFVWGCLQLSPLQDFCKLQTRILTDREFSFIQVSEQFCPVHLS